MSKHYLTAAGPRLAYVLLSGLMVLGASSLPSKAQNATRDCTVTPDTDNAEPVAPRGDETAEALADCNGVLSPAPVGDRELLEPAPDAGTTPVIEPKDLPDQSPDAETLQ